MRTTKNSLSTAALPVAIQMTPDVRRGRFTLDLILGGMERASSKLTNSTPATKLSYLNRMARTPLVKRNPGDVLTFEKGDEPPKLYLDDMDKLILGRVAQTPIRRPKKQAVVKNKRKAAEEATEEATESPAAKKIKLEDETVVMLSARQYAKQVAGRDVETPDVDTIIKSEPCNADAESKLIEQQELRDRMNNAQFRHQNLINHIMSTQIAYSRHAQLLATRLKTLTEEQKVLKTDLSSLENSMASSKSLVAHLEKEKECAAGKK